MFPDNLTRAEAQHRARLLSTSRYAVDIDRGSAGEPEAIVLGDRVLQVLGVVWLGLFAASAMWP